ncbi:MAG TPA: tetratricopeptide repeat protein [Blastocatellia bacterium]|nr:tetratricopeptide repeat protein [Blastocatellia bacterium]
MTSPVISHYRIVKKLGAGGMGEVYLAEDTKLGRKVAIKSLLPESIGDGQARARLLREARAAARLDHPNICAIHEVVDAEDSSYIVMQYVEGETLAALIKQRCLTFETTVEIAMKVADALDAAHSHRIVHRDIKPQNIIVTPQGNVKVLDFGLAKIGDQQASGDADTQSLTNSAGGAAVIMGTAAYMSPEQAGSQAVDQRSDLFSLGTILYECLTGLRPFTGANLAQVLAHVLNLEPAPPSSVDSKIPCAADEVILKALAKSPEARYQTASAFREELARLLSDLHREQEEQTRPPRHPAPKPRLIRFKKFRQVVRRRRNILLLGCAATLAMISVAAWIVPSLAKPTTYEPNGEAKRRYEEGVNALRDGAYYKAVRHLNLAIQADNKFPLAHARLAEALLELDHRKKAESEMLLARSMADRVTLSAFEGAYLQAANRTLVRDLSGAIEKYKEALALANYPEKASVYFDLGRAYERNEETGPARNNYNSALAGDPGNATATMRLGVLAAREMDSAGAETRFKDAERRYHELDNVEGETEAVFLRGYLLNTRDQLKDAREILMQALERAKALDNQAQEVAILLHLSNIACSEGDTAKAESIASEAVDLAKQEGMEGLAVDGLIAVGNAFLIRRDIAAAERHFNEALDLSRTYEGEIGEKRALLALASANEQRSKPDEVVRIVGEALPFLERGNYKREMAQATSLMARANRKLGKYDEAIRIYTQSLELLTQLEDRSEIALCHAGIGLVLSYIEHYSEALDQYQRASAIHEMLRDEYNRGYETMNIARLLFQLGRYDEADSSFMLAAELAHRTGPNLHLQTYVYIYLGRMALSQGRYAAAESRCKQALGLAGPTSREEIVLAKMTIGESMSLSGRVRTGVEICREAVTLASELGNPRHLSEARLALARTLLMSDDIEASLYCAQKAESEFEQLGKHDSLWRALVVEATCQQRLGDSGTARAVAARAAETLSVVEKQLGTQVFQIYRTRTDVVRDQEALKLALGTTLD